MGFDKMDKSGMVVGGGSSGESESESEPRLQELEVKERRKKPGIIYLSSVPEGMNVSQTTGFFSEFGRVGRVFLQPDNKSGQRHFTEGWIEFVSKKIAKRVAEQLNNTPVGGKRRSKSFNTIWNIKYLPRFKWVHLSERLAYEQAVRQQRMRTEISQVKREAEQFKSSVIQEKKKKKKKDRREPDPADADDDNLAAVHFTFRQRETDSAIRKRKAEQEVAPDERTVSPPKRKKSKKSKSSLESDGRRSKSASTGGAGGLGPVSAGRRQQKKKAKKSSSSAKEGRGGGGSGGTAANPRRKSSEGGDRSAFLRSVFGSGQ